MLTHDSPSKHFAHSSAVCTEDHWKTATIYCPPSVTRAQGVRIFQPILTMISCEGDGDWWDWESGRENLPLMYTLFWISNLSHTPLTWNVQNHQVPLVVRHFLAIFLLFLDWNHIQRSVLYPLISCWHQTNHDAIPLKGLLAATCLFAVSINALPLLPLASDAFERLFRSWFSKLWRRSTLFYSSCCYDYWLLIKNINAMSKSLACNSPNSLFWLVREKRTKKTWPKNIVFFFLLLNPEIQIKEYYHL